ncbi:coiled-coil domain containing 7A [Cricetulus griseus]
MKIVSSLEYKPQETINAKHHPPVLFPTKVINLLPFTSQGQSESQKIKKNGAEPHQNLNVSASSIKKQKLKELSKIPDLDDEDAKLSNELPKSTSAAKKSRSKEPSKTKKLGKNEGTPPLHMSPTGKKTRVLQDWSKPITLGDKGAQHLSSLNISTSATKKNVLKGRHKPTTLDKKGVDLPNNLVPSASASRMHELKGQPKATMLNKEGVDLLKNLTPSASASSKHGLKGQRKSAKSDEKGLKFPSTLRPSASTTRKRLLVKGKELVSRVELWIHSHAPRRTPLPQLEGQADLQEPPTLPHPRHSVADLLELRLHRDRSTILKLKLSAVHLRHLLAKCSYCD